MAAKIGGPPPKPVANIPAPPQMEETKGNLNTTHQKQFNVRLSPEKHREIKIAAIREGMSLGEYLEFLHNDYQGKLKART